MNPFNQIKYALCPLRCLIKKSDKLYADYCASKDFRDKMYKDAAKISKELSDFNYKARESDTPMTPSEELNQEAAREEIEARRVIAWNKHALVNKKYLKIKDKCIKIRIEINRRNQQTKDKQK